MIGQIYKVIVRKQHESSVIGALGGGLAYNYSIIKKQSADKRLFIDCFSFSCEKTGAFRIVVPASFI